MESGGIAATPAESHLIAVLAEFEKVLGSQVSDSDDFFSLGGSSLLAARVAAGVTARCAKSLSLVDILRLRTPRAIASHLEKAPDPPSRTLPTTTAGERYELSPTQRWYSKVYTGRLQPTGVMSFVVELPDGTAPGAVWLALDAMLKRHDSLRTSVQAMDGRLVQRVPDVGTTTLQYRPGLGDRPGLRDRPWAVLEEVPGGRADVSRAAAEVRAECAAQGIALDGGPLFRAILLSGTEPAADRPAELVIVIHHVIFDGASVPVFTRELLALLADPTDALRSATSYRAYTSWRLDRESPARISAERSWWSDQLAGFESRSHLPVRGEPGYHVGYATSRTLPESVRTALAAAAKRHLVPVSAVRIAAYFMLCHALYGNRDMVIGMPISVRDHPALRDGIGMFVNVVLVRHRIKERESVRELVQDVLVGLTGAVDHREHSFDLVMSQLPERCEPGRFPITGAVINGAETDAPEGPPAPEPRTEGLRRCNVCDIQLFFTDAPNRVDLELQHRADMLSPADGRRVLDCYLGLLTLIARSDDGAVDTLLSYARDVLAPVRQGAAMVGDELVHDAG